MLCCHLVVKIGNTIIERDFPLYSTPQKLVSQRSSTRKVVYYIRWPYLHIIAYIDQNKIYFFNLFFNECQRQQLIDVDL